MSIDYKKELETAARTMILVHDPKLLIKMIVRMIVQKVKVSHASILLHDQAQDTYVMAVSRGRMGLKVPEGFTRMDQDNALISFLKQHRPESIFGTDVLIYDKAKDFLNVLEGTALKHLETELKNFLSQALYQMDIFESVACIPSYFRDELVGILLLGKKQDSTPFEEDELSFLTALAYDVSMAIRNAQLFEALKEELDKKQSLFFHTTIALAAAIEAKDRYTSGHTTRVTNYALEIAKRLSEKNKKGTDGKFFEDLHIASLLHDIGKIGVPEAILNKQGPLTDEERKKIQEHPLIGVNILQPIRELKNTILGVRHHHERFDGFGYPDGLKGEDIPLIAAVISVADAYDAMTSDRPYRRGLTKDEAVEEIKRQNSKQFDPQVVAAFLELIEESNEQLCLKRT